MYHVRDVNTYFASSKIHRLREKIVLMNLAKESRAILSF